MKKDTGLSTELFPASKQQESRVKKATRVIKVTPAQKVLRALRVNPVRTVLTVLLLILAKTATGGLVKPIPE